MSATICSFANMLLSLFDTVLVVPAKSPWRSRRFRVVPESSFECQRQCRRCGARAIRATAQRQNRRGFIFVAEGFPAAHRRIDVAVLVASKTQQTPGLARITTRPGTALTPEPATRFERTVVRYCSRAPTLRNPDPRLGAVQSLFPPR